MAGLNYSVRFENEKHIIMKLAEPLKNNNSHWLAVCAYYILFQSFQIQCEQNY